MINAKISAKIADSHMPLICKNIGKMNTQSIWKTSVLKIETNADINPLFNAVKNDEVNMFIPEKINEKAKIFIALVVKLNKSLLYATKIADSGLASKNPTIVIINPVKTVKKQLFFSIITENFKPKQGE